MKMGFPEEIFIFKLLRLMIQGSGLTLILIIIVSSKLTKLINSTYQIQQMSIQTKQYIYYKFNSGFMYGLDVRLKQLF